MKMQILDLSRVSGGDPEGLFLKLKKKPSFPRERGDYYKKRVVP